MVKKLLLALVALSALSLLLFVVSSCDNPSQEYPENNNGNDGDRTIKHTGTATIGKAVIEDKKDISYPPLPPLCPPEPGCPEKESNGFIFAVLSRINNCDGTYSFTFRVTNNNRYGLSHVTLCLPSHPHKVVPLSPTEGSIYNSPIYVNPPSQVVTYTVSLMNHPWYGLKFDKNPGGNEIKNGSFDEFTFTTDHDLCGYSFCLEAKAGSKTGNVTITCTGGCSENCDQCLNDLPPVITGVVATPATATLGQTVTFDVTATDPEGKPIAGYYWDFGDGSNSNEKSTTHTYAALGTFTATITVTDACNKIATETRVITVVDKCYGNDSPIAGFTLSKTEVIPGEMFTITSTATDPNGDPLTTTYDLGDGNSYTGPNTTYSYGSIGIYTIKQTVDDGCGPVICQKQVTVKVLPLGAKGVCYDRIGKLYSWSVNNPNSFAVNISWAIDAGPILGSTDIPAFSNVTITTSKTAGSNILKISWKNAAGAEESAFAEPNNNYCKPNNPPTIYLSVEGDFCSGNLCVVAHASDADGDSLVYVWIVNGHTIPGVMDRLCNTASFSMGPNKVVVKVNDGFDEATASKIITRRECCDEYTLGLTTDKENYLAYGYDAGIATATVYKEGIQVNDKLITFTINNGEWIGGIYGYFNRKFKSGTPTSATITASTDFCVLNAQKIVYYSWFGECKSFDTWLKSDSSKGGSWTYGFIKPCPAGSPNPEVIFKGYEFYRNEVQINAVEYSPGIYRDLEPLDKNGTYIYKAFAVYEYRGQTIKIPAGGPTQAVLR